MSIYEIKGNVEINRKGEFSKEPFCEFAECIDNLVVGCNRDWIDLPCKCMGSTVELYVNSKHLKLNPCYYDPKKK